MNFRKKFMERNRIMQSIRHNSRSGGLINHFRYWPNNSDQHEDVKYLIYKNLIKNNCKVLTEAVFNNGSRCDVLAIKGGRGVRGE